MKKTTKGALAAVAGGSLLLGGAGSLAYWTGDSTVTGDSISSGTLDMTAPDCSDDVVAGTHGWQFDGTNAAFNPAADQVVPGDTLTKVCNITLSLVGSHIGATLAFDTAQWGAGSASGLTDELVPSVAFTVNGQPYAAITTAGVYTIQAAISVDFPYGTGTDNDSNSPLAGPALEAILEDIVVTATQTHDNA
ncbi:alternate-type signal peptide domain-containing protein [Nocardioides caricicola]|uniref:Alternate-type signal peptide domain-containing protein n=1 Tax=Nocardioides caricicola TaxID=634770 RepID=A0ABW0N6U5_9ACTN